MPTFKFTTRIADSITDAGGITSISPSASGPAMANASGGRIRIMGGGVPIQSELDEAWTGWDRVTGSPTEILIDLPTISSPLYFDGVDDLVTWGLRTVTASVGGVATWFLWSGNQVNYNPPDDFRYISIAHDWLPSMIGTISGIGLGGDMTLVDTTIVAGATYEIGPATFSIPRSYTYT